MNWFKKDVMDTDIIEILEKIQEVSIAVHGDFCLDAYWIIDPIGSEISVETGQQAEAIAKHYYSPGGAANVVANIAALQPKRLKAIGVIGNDIHGRELSAQLEAVGTDTSSLLIQKEDFSTYAFTKKYIDEKEQSRSDFGTANQRSVETDKALIKEIQVALETYDVLVFNQQIPGSITNQSFISEVNKLFTEYIDRIVLLDSRHCNSQFKNVHLKLNEIEVAKLNEVEVDYRDHISLTDVEDYGLKVFKKYGKPIFITCGSRGIISIDNDGIYKTPGIQLLSKIDTVGAGDTALSAIALCLGAGYSPPQAARFANYAAAVTVQKTFTTGTASANEILEISRDANFIYRPELARNIRQAKYIERSDIEICEEKIVAQIGQIKHAVFDHDGTISILREGWEKVMEPMMIKAILGEQYNTATAEVYDKIRRTVLDYINQSTGIQTIVQMEKLAQMVDEFGIVPKNQILNSFGYKSIFNKALLEMVDKRINKLKREELTVEDFTIKGAVSFLQAIKTKGVKLYLASGTDQEDVIQEANLLGYANLFDGGIYGSVGDLKQYSKQMVLDNIIRENQLQGSEVLVIGDGPVEIQACRKVGGIAIGIACDEARRHGLNPEKRERLIRAGADLVIPDFSQGSRLLELLGLG